MSPRDSIRQRAEVRVVKKALQGVALCFRQPVAGVRYNEGLLRDLPRV
jgi:hypothetical protein